MKDASEFNKNTMKQYVNEMIAEDIIVIAASGNDESNEVAVCRRSNYALNPVS